jgi:hypothetical protein
MIKKRIVKEESIVKTHRTFLRLLVTVGVQSASWLSAGVAREVIKSNQNQSDRQVPLEAVTRRNQTDRSAH